MRHFRRHADALAQRRVQVNRLAVPLGLNLALAHAQNRHFRRVDDRREVTPANAAQAGDGEGGAAHFGRAEFAVARFFGQLAHLLRDLQDALFVAVLDDRHHQTVRRVSGKTDVVKKLDWKAILASHIKSSVARMSRFYLSRSLVDKSKGRLAPLLFARTPA